MKPINGDMAYLYIYNNGRNVPASVWYPQNCTLFCTTFALKTMRSLMRSFAQTMMQTMYQTMCGTIYQTILKPIAVFARDSARDLTHFDATEND